MEVKTEGIVVKNNRYSNSSLITKIYTETYGLLTFMVKGAYRRNSKLPVSFFQPLQLLDLEISYREGRNFQTIREAKTLSPKASGFPSPVQNAIGIFLAELFDHIFSAGGEPDPELFRFLQNDVIFDLYAEEPSPNLPLFVFKEMSGYLGIKPMNNHSAECRYFNVAEGGFSTLPSKYDQVLLEKDGAYMSNLLNAGKQDYPGLKLSSEVRRRLIRAFDQYFAFHLPGYTCLKSYSILSDVMS